MGSRQLLVLAAILTATLTGGCESTGGGTEGTNAAVWTAGFLDYSGTLSGSNTVRVRNLNDFDIRVGLRSGGRGRDLTVPARDSAEVKVPDGRYDVYLQYAVDRTSIYQGDSFTLNGHGMEIDVMLASGGAAGAKKVN